MEFSACVPPAALHMGMTYDFHIGDLGFYKGSLSHFYQWSAWQLFFVSIQARNSSVEATKYISNTVGTAELMQQRLQILI